MRPISANLRAHLQGETLTVCTLWRVARRDGAVYGFTDHTRSLVYAGTNYLASTGHTPSSVKTSSALSVDNLDIQAVLNSATITEADIQAGLWDYAAIEIMLVNYLALADGHMTLRRGWLGNIKTGRHNFVAELRGMMQPLQQTIGRAFAPGCDADLGDARCKVALGPHTVTGSVTAVTGARQFTDALRIEATNHFAGGLITWTSGPNNTYRMEVKSSTSGGVIVLQQAMPNPIAVGHTYSMIAGCDKALATCQTKFANVPNFRGFPYVPGQDRMLSGK